MENSSKGFYPGRGKISFWTTGSLLGRLIPYEINFDMLTIMNYPMENILLVPQ